MRTPSRLAPNDRVTGLVLAIVTALGSHSTYAGSPGHRLVVVEGSIDKSVFLAGYGPQSARLCVTNTNDDSDPTMGLVAGDSFVFRLPTPACGSFSEFTPSACGMDVTVATAAPIPILPSDFTCAVLADEVTLRYVAAPKAFLFEDRFCIEVNLDSSTPTSCGLEYRVFPHSFGGSLSLARLFEPAIPGSMAIDSVDPLAGPTGPTGDTGPVGPAGIPGPAGATGVQGVPGSTGVVGPAGPTGVSGATGANGPSGPTGASGPSGPSGPPGSRDAWALLGNGGTDPAINFLGTTDATDLVLRTGSSERIRVSKDGDVGVGTPAPAARLHLYGGHLLVSDQSLYGQRTSQEIKSDSLRPWADEGVRIYDANSPSHLTIDSNGTNTFVKAYITGEPAELEGIDYGNIMLQPFGGSVGVGLTGPGVPAEVVHIASGNLLVSERPRLGDRTSHEVLTDNIRPWADKGLWIKDGNSPSYLELDSYGFYSSIQAYEAGLTNIYGDLLLQKAEGSLGIGVVDIIQDGRLIDTRPGAYLSADGCWVDAPSCTRIRISEDRETIEQLMATVRQLTDRVADLEIRLKAQEPQR